LHGDLAARVGASAALTAPTGPGLVSSGSATSPPRSATSTCTSSACRDGRLADGRLGADLELFRAYLARRRVAERRILLRALRGARLRRLLDDWAGELSALGDSARSADGAAWSACALAVATIARAHRRVVHSGTSISDSSPPQDLHVLLDGRPAQAAAPRGRRAP
jgi:hypothetical protein